MFSTEQELEIANQIKHLASIFYGVTTKELRRFVLQFAERNHIIHNFNATQRLAGKDWLRSFIRRNSIISVRKAEATSLNRVTGFNKDQIARFYKLVEEVMSKYNFSPSKIYNADETGITTVQDPGKILAIKGQKRVGVVTSGERGRNITVICAMNAAG